MGIRIIRLLIPPIIISLYRKLRHKKDISFSGVFNTITEVKNENPWIKKPCIELSKRKLERTKNDCRIGFMPASDFSGYQILPCLVINILSENKSCNILDFAGGAGVVYHRIFPYLMNPENVIWHVVDSNPELYEIGKKHADALNRSNIIFHMEIPGKDKIKFDVVFINTSLQYVYDYDCVLNTLLQYNPEYVVLTRLITGDMETYITCQDINGYSTPCIFINFQELVKIFSKNGYKLVFKSPCPEEDFREHYDTNIPEHLRLPCSTNLVFRQA